MPADGWISARTLTCFGITIVMLCAFVAIERRLSTPLIPLALFREGSVVVPNAIVFLQSMVGIAWLYALTLYFQDVLAYSALVAGLLFLPMTVSSVISASLAGGMVTRAGEKRTATTGLVLVIAGLLLMATMQSSGGLPLVLAGMVIGEFGFMLAIVPLTISATAGLEEGTRGLGAGVLNTSMQLGGALGLGVTATIVAASGAASTGNAVNGETLVEGLRYGLLASVVVGAVALVLVITKLHGQPRIQNAA